jgi:serine/threonine protein kinase
MAKIEVNNVKNRFLPIPESVAKGLEPEPKITDFSIIKELGSGSFGRVYLVTHKKTKAQYAIKAIDKRDKTNIEEKPYFRREVEVMYKIHHPNVVKLFGHFEDNNYCYFIMEYISKGNIYGLIPQDKKKRLSSQIVASLIKDVISAVYYLHNMNPPIIHRDIKPENVLLGDRMVAKLTDFGWSNYMQEDAKRTTVCGTPIYLAPEIIKEQGHDERVDVWCIGVLLFELTTATVPFPGNDLDTLKKNILKLKIAWPKDINSDAKNLIMKILKLDPNDRLPLSEMLSHRFITKYFPNAAQSLIKPDNNSKAKTFIVSKDDPNTWDPYQTDNPQNEQKINKQRSRGQSPKERGKSPKRVPTDSRSPRNDKEKKPENVAKDRATVEKYKNLKEKYENLLKDYNLLKTRGNVGEPLDNELKSLKNVLKDKEEKVAQLLGMIKNTGKEGENNNENNDNESYLKMRVDELDKENESLKNKIKRYEEFIKTQQGGEIDNNLIELRASMTNNNKADFSNAIEKLKKRINDDSQNNLNEIIIEKERELAKIKEDEQIRREKEKKKYATVINKFDKTLNLIEKENKMLRDKIKYLMLNDDSKK